jgi:hypothetical protein
MHYGPGVDSPSNRIKYQEFFWGVKEQLADNLTAICEPMSRKCGSLDIS